MVDAFEDFLMYDNLEKKNFRSGTINQKLEGDIWG